MKHTIQTTIAITAVILAISIAGCNSGGSAAASQTVTINGEHGKVYTGTANQVSSQMGQDYAAGLRNMANQASTKPQ